MKSSILIFRALSADKALTRFARQTDLTLLFPYREVKKVKTRRLYGRFTIRDGLQQMLRGSGIEISAGVGNEKESGVLETEIADQSKPQEELEMPVFTKKINTKRYHAGYCKHWHWPCVRPTGRRR